MMSGKCGENKGFLQETRNSCIEQIIKKSDLSKIFVYFAKSNDTNYTVIFYA